MSKIAKFTEFEQNTNWCSGEVGNYNFGAKLFDVGSVFGIRNGRVSKLFLQDKDTGELVVNYDRGWDVKPTEEVKPFYRAVMKLLNNAPKRFS